MANSFASLKKSRNASLDKLLQETAKLSEGGQQQSNGPDGRIWKPTVDKAGNGYAVIRFLPEAKGEDLPWVRMFDHGFQGTGGWYIENSLTTIGQKDPCGEMNSELWNNGTDAGKEQARKQKRRLKYFSNIVVVKDPSNPQNEGKVFLYQFGKKIWDKINDLMQPEFEDETPVNPFDFWEGADFKLKIRKVEGYRNYDKSEFDAPSELFDGDDDQLEKVYEGLYSLQELVSPDKFKSYDELKQKLNKVLGLQVAPRPAYDDVEDTIPSPAPKEAPPKQFATTADSVEDDDLSFFEQLANN
tara:strand:+ start:102 stop:1001 length:900 start_codon:yes stop_codon:yes gene_type:complete